MRFDLADLRLFLAVAEAGNITRGAAEVGLSLAAASERLRAMEATGNVMLLERGRRGVSLTQAGEALAHHARLIERQMARMRGELSEHAKGLRATIQVLANTAAIMEFLPGRLASWMAMHPTIDLDLKERQSAEIARAISAGHAEIGILSDAVETGDLHLRHFATDRLVIVAGKQWRFAGQANIAFREVLDQDFIGLMDGALQSHIEDQAMRLGRKLKLRVRVRSFEGICRLVSNGAGIAIIPATAARRFRRSHALSEVRIADAWASRRLVLCCQSPDWLTNQARHLFAHLALNA
ncbi:MULTISPECIES: LysR family transcriptional regulator [Rhizobium]|uniref:RuBisCO transcriptional regulator n=1 Tax=Rhizobium favelukesii TaxID=348824 RepID=W6RDR0_9HYPH|nr:MULTISPECIES: LysR family transcriptional regulator [Rhizobium]MCA0803006.1 LysR family transcriptional regulator [Rhizobium sp. T1473]MCS0461423.1 LysR family transcriptional regulator [Rhizobium favelukesii]UFS83435.1 LysR family transcriptional regulator [Rhizobium sp. T136]CDM58974.1 putative RuBisCO transcriptional regulator [Rhizobium favelukesii]